MTTGTNIQENIKVLSSSQQKLIENAFLDGIPQELRKHVWKLILPNTLKVNEKLYKVLCERSKVCMEFADRDTAFKKSLKVIDEDIHRTYADTGLFRVGNKFHDPLKNILMAYSLFRPDLGYVQGMSYVAASLLLHFGSELETF